MTNDPKTLKARLRSIADASRREDETDIPLGVQLREAADALDQRDARIETLEAALREARPYVPEHHGPVIYKIDAALNGGDGK